MSHGRCHGAHDLLLLPWNAYSLCNVEHTRVPSVEIDFDSVSTLSTMGMAETTLAAASDTFP